MFKNIKGTDTIFLNYNFSFSDKIKEDIAETRYYHIFVNEEEATSWKIKALANINLTEIIGIMENATGNFIEEVLKSLKESELNTNIFRKKLKKWLEVNGNKPPLSERSIYTRSKMSITTKVRNIITGDWINYLYLVYSTKEPENATYLKVKVNNV